MCHCTSASRPEISAQVANFVKVDTGDARAAPLMNPAVRNDPVVFPPADVLSKPVFTGDLGDTDALYQDAWSRVLSA